MQKRGKKNPKTKYLYIYPIKAGFPSPAEEYLETVLDITSLVIQNPTFNYKRIENNTIMGLLL
ncbi:hypothetical protein LEP1GSC074_0610 [Leptospira noguchii str. Hook]|nr:hypothetical protein LEP1GSC074_0610 [Leptospira noguchii str. Hook]